MSLSWLKSLNDMCTEGSQWGKDGPPSRIIKDIDASFWRPFSFRIVEVFEDRSKKKVSIIRVDRNTKEDIDNEPFTVRIGTKFIELMQGANLGGANRILWTKWYALTIYGDYRQLFVWEARMVPNEGEINILDRGIWIAKKRRRKRKIIKIKIKKRRRKKHRTFTSSLKLL